MKIFLLIVSIFRWLLAGLFSILALGGLISGEFIMSGIMIIISLILIPPIINLIFFRSSVGSGGFYGFLQTFNSGKSFTLVESLNFNDKENLIAEFEQKASEKTVVLTSKGRYNIGLEIYRRLLKNALLDMNLVDIEKQYLENVVTYFKLSVIDILNVKQTFSRGAILKLIQISYEDKILTEDEKIEIDKLAAYLNFPKIEVENIRMKIASNLLKIAFDEKLADKRLSPIEETELNKTLHDLNIDKDSLNLIMNKKSMDDLAYAKLLWSFENGLFYPIPNPRITLKRLEKCYLFLPAALVERKTVHKGYSHASQGISIPIMKGVRYKVSAGKSVPIKEEITLKYSGNLYLTNSRIIFSSGAKSFEILFPKLLTFSVYRNGIEFMLNNKSFLLQMELKSIELFAVGLTSSVRNFMEGDNELHNAALTEVEENERFIDASNR